MLMPTPAVLTVFVVVMMMPVIVGMIMVMATATRMIMATTIVGFLTTALPAREQDKKKSGGEHEGDDDRQVHNDYVTNRTVGRGGSLVECASNLSQFSRVTPRNSPAIVKR